MPKVKVTREHFNGYGDTYEKAKGSTYEVPTDEAAQQLADEGLVTVEKTSGGSRQSDGPSGN